MTTKIHTWNRVVFESEHGENEYDMYQVFKSEKKHHAINLFCEWYNALLEANEDDKFFYAKRDENSASISIYKKSSNRDIPDKKINEFGNFKFFDTTKQYHGEHCPAFKNVNSDYVVEVG